MIHELPILSTHAKSEPVETLKHKQRFLTTSNLVKTKGPNGETILNGKYRVL